MLKCENVVYFSHKLLFLEEELANLVAQYTVEAPLLSQDLD
jgi:hypothetical protein